MDICVICGEYCGEGTMVCINCLDKWGKNERLYSLRERELLYIND